MNEWDLKPEEIKKRLDNMVWSFSRLQSASQCKYAWYLHYIAGEESAPNAYSQFGTLVHETLEKFLKGELDIFNVAQYYQDNYSDYVTCDFPPNKYVDLGQKAYDDGEQYFLNLNFDFDRYEILGVEKEVKFNVGGYPFKGFIDALYRDKETGDIIILDHKTSSFKYLKNGGISKSNQEHFQQFRRQELLYAIPIIEEYGKVDYLSWNMIRDQKEIKIPFNHDEFLETQEWAVKTIKQIEEELLWAPDNSNGYFCHVLCDIRDKCIYNM